MLQGQPAEPDSGRALHLETSHIMSARSLAHLFDHLYRVVGWRGSTAERMMHLLRASRNGTNNPYYGGGIQEGFGLLCTDSSIEMRDWSFAYRSPYWNHRLVVDWTGAVHNFSLPMLRVLFAPVQLLHSSAVRRRYKSCCEPSAAACHGMQRACIVDVEQSHDDCCLKRRARDAGEASVSTHSLRVRLSVPDNAEIGGSQHQSLFRG